MMYLQIDLIQKLSSIQTTKLYVYDCMQRSTVIFPHLDVLTYSTSNSDFKKPYETAIQSLMH